MSSKRRERKGYHCTRKHRETHDPRRSGMSAFVGVLEAHRSYVTKLNTVRPMRHDDYLTPSFAQRVNRLLLASQQVLILKPKTLYELHCRR